MPATPELLESIANDLARIRTSEEAHQRSGIDSAERRMSDPTAAEFRSIVVLWLRIIGGILVLGVVVSAIAGIVFINSGDEQAGSERDASALADCIERADLSAEDCTDIYG